MNGENPYQPTIIDSHVVDQYVVENGEVLATRGERFAGAFIDGLINMVIAFPLALVIGLAFGAVFGDGLAVQLLAQVTAGAMAFVVFLGIHGYLLATRGKTVGKVVMGTTIVDRDTNALLPFGKLIVARYLWLQATAIIPVVGAVVPLINALLIFRSNRACLHDDIANTKVIKDR